MYLKLAWRNIWRNKRRSFITIGSITFAVLLACVMRSMQLGSYERMIENAARFYTGYIQLHENGYWEEKTIDRSFDFDPALLEMVEQTDGVDLGVPRVESFALAAYGTKTKGSMVLGMDPSKEDGLTRIKEKLVEGEYLTNDDNGVLIAEGLAKYLKIGIGDTLVLLGQGYHGSNAAGLFPVKGIAKFPVPTQNDQTIYLSLSKAQWFYGVDNQITSLSLVVDKAEHGGQDTSTEALLVGLIGKLGLSLEEALMRLMK